MIIFLTLFSLLAMAAGVVFSSHNAAVKASILLLSGLVLCLWFFVDSMSGDGINYATLYHLTSDMRGAGVSDFSRQILTLVVSALVCFMLASLLYFYATRRGCNRSGFRFVFIYGFILFLGVNPVTSDLFKLARDYEFSTNADSAVIEEYVTALPDLAFKKNVVYIYAESLEQTYFNEAVFPGLVPGLRRIIDDGIKFDNVIDAKGTGWTIAGMVSSLCGVPLTVTSNRDGNSFDRFGRFLPQAYCLTDHLRDQGYSLDFLGGADVNFAGKGSFLASHGFTTVRGLDYFNSLGVGDENFSSWGLHDDVLLEKAYDRFVELSNSNNPFFLGVLTLDTHHPSGHVSSGCNGYRYEGIDRELGILNAIGCSDILLSRFIERIRESDYYEDTIIVLASDHVAMANDARSILKADGLKRTNLFVILDKDVLPRVLNKPMTTIDNGATLLSHLVDKPVSLGFGRSGFDSSAVSFSHAIHSKADSRDYFDFSKSLWGFESSGLIKVNAEGKIVIGGQTIAPPITIKFDESYSVDGVVLDRSARDELTAESGTPSLDIDYCGYVSLSPVNAYCGVIYDGNGKSAVIPSQELLSGVGIAGFRHRKYKDVNFDRRRYIIQDGFSSDFPSLIDGVVSNRSVFSNMKAGVLFNGPFVDMPAGHYQVQIMGNVPSGARSWADVIHDQGLEVVSRGPLVLQRSGDNVIYNDTFELLQDTRNIEVRVYAEDGEAVRIDGYYVYPISY